MQIFIGLITGASALVEDEEAKHAIKVLRKKPGDEIAVIDGSGTLYRCEITEMYKSHLYAQIKEEMRDFGKIPYALHLAFAPTKNSDRIEWMLEKATEMGVTAFYPIQTQRTERTKLKPERLERILVAATKQSLKGKVPIVQPLQDFKTLLEMPFSGNKFIAHCAEGDKKPLFSEANNYLSALVCIGPEGDFTEDEINLAIKNDFKAVSLGNSRLRTETAALAAVSAFYHKFLE